MVASLHRPVTRRTPTQFSATLALMTPAQPRAPPGMLHWTCTRCTLPGMPCGPTNIIGGPVILLTTIHAISFHDMSQKRESVQTSNGEIVSVLAQVPSPSGKKLQTQRVPDQKGRYHQVCSHRRTQCPVHQGSTHRRRSTARTPKTRPERSRQQPCKTEGLGDSACRYSETVLRSSSRVERHTHRRFSSHHPSFPVFEIFAA